MADAPVVNASPIIYLVLRAKRLGWIPAARPVVERLRGAGMYLSDRVLGPALGLVGE